MTKNKKKSRFLLGAGAGAALVLMALFYRCSNSGSFGIGSDGKPVVTVAHTTDSTEGRTEPPCELRMDSEGLKLDGNPVELKVALEACKKRGKANLFITGGANYGKLQNTLAALKQAGVEVVEQRKRGSKRDKAPDGPDNPAKPDPTKPDPAKPAPAKPAPTQTP